MLLVLTIIAIIVGTVILSIWVDPPRYPPAPDHVRDSDLRRRRYW